MNAILRYVNMSEAVMMSLSTIDTIHDGRIFHLWYGLTKHDTFVMQLVDTCLILYFNTVLHATLLPH